MKRLAELVDLTASDIRVCEKSKPGSADAVLEAAGSTFVVEWKGSGATGPVAAAAEQVRRYAAAIGKRAIPLVAVPFMGPVGRQRCAEAGVAWLDLSGNARISAPGIRVLVDGQPNRFKERGRPSSPFAPKSSRIARWLLMHQDRLSNQRDIARATEMDEGFTSRIVAKLEADGLVVRDEQGAIQSRDPDLLLDAWREGYDFSKHRILHGHVAARSGEALLGRVVEVLSANRVEYAATGLAAAWILTRFAGFRVASVFVLESPSQQVLKDMGFRDDSRGANTWIVVPNDEGVFQGAADYEGVRCVHPVQVYLDLKGHPERAAEAADQLRAEHFRWRADG